MQQQPVGRGMFAQTSQPAAGSAASAQSGHQQQQQTGQRMTRLEYMLQRHMLEEPAITKCGNSGQR